MKTTTLKMLLLLSVVQASVSFAYTCQARSFGGAQCGGTYSGYNAQSKGLAIKDALDNCSSSAPSGCTCTLSSCSDNFIDEITQ